MATASSAMAAAANAEPGVAWPLLEPKGIADDGPARDGGATTAAAAVDTAIGCEVVWFETRRRTLVLRTSRLEKPDPCGYGGRPIRLIPEVISADKNLVLFNLRSPHPAIPTESFVYSFSTVSAGAGTPSVVRLPHATLDITVPHSTGILRAKDGESYVVASLWQKFNSATGELDTFFHRWCYSSSSSEWTQQRQRVILPSHRSTWEWRTDCVVPFEESLLWVDLTHGILLFRNLGHGGDLKIHFVRLPSNLPPAYSRGVARPELFRSVGCCNGKLTLVNLLYKGDGDTLEVAIWTLQTSYARNNGEFNWKWNKESNICTSFECQILWNFMSAKLQYTNKDLLPPWNNRLPCFPVVSKDNSEILYLTVAGKQDDHAWLLQIDMQAKAPKDVVDYPGFCRHKEPPRPSDLSKYSPP